MSTVYIRSIGSGEVFETESPQFWNDAEKYERLSAKIGRELLREQSREKILKCVKPGDKIYTVLRAVSASGMTRRIDVYAIVDNAPVYLSGYASHVLGWRLSNKRGIICEGGGMDMGFHLVYSLSSRLWPNGTPEPHGTRNGEPDSSGGYALKQEWL